MLPFWYARNLLSVTINTSKRDKAHTAVFMTVTSVIATEPGPRKDPAREHGRAASDTIAEFKRRSLARLAMKP